LIVFSYVRSKIKFLLWYYQFYLIDIQNISSYFPIKNNNLKCEENRSFFFPEASYYCQTLFNNYDHYFNNILIIFQKFSLRFFKIQYRAIVYANSIKENLSRIAYTTLYLCNYDLLWTDFSPVSLNAMQEWVHRFTSCLKPGKQFVQCSTFCYCESRDISPSREE